MTRRSWFEWVGSALAYAAAAAGKVPLLQGDDGGGVDHHLCPECGGRDGKHEWRIISRTVHDSGWITLRIRLCRRSPMEPVTIFGPPLLPKRLGRATVK